MTPLLLHTAGTGNCSAFAHLLKAALAANGIVSTDVAIGARPVTEADSEIPFDVGQFPFMLVKNWGFPDFESATFRIIFPSFPFLLRLNTDDFMFPPRNDFGDITNNSGLPGQNMATPGEKVFGSHYILKVDSALTVGLGIGQYLDGAYGVTYTGAQEFQSTAIDGVALPLGTDPEVEGTDRWKSLRTTNIQWITFYEQ